jgi:predicted ArsR family transcriptional regulator
VATKTTTAMDKALTKLRRSKHPKTAAQLGVPAARLKTQTGVTVVGTTKSGGRGRPAFLFALAESE